MSIILGRFDSGRGDSPLTGRYDGPKAEACDMPAPTVVRFTAEERRKIRAGEMLRKRLDGWHTDDIAAHYQISRQHVNFEIRDMPDWYRKSVEEGHRRGALRMA